MSKQPNACDACGRARTTLYQKSKRLVCYYCLPDEDLSGARALRTIRSAVKGALNIERLRGRLRSLTK